MVATLWIISDKKYEASDESLDAFTGIATFNKGPPVTGVCSIIISASVVAPSNKWSEGDVMLIPETVYFSVLYVTGGFLLLSYVKLIKTPWFLAVILLLSWLSITEHD